MLPLPHARRKRARADSTRCAMEHRAVARFTASVVPALHAALKPFALAHATHVHVLTHLETIHQHAVAGLCLVLRILQANLAKVPHRRNASLFEMAGQRLVDPLRLDKFHEAQLDSVIAVLIHRAPLHHDTWAGLQHRERHCCAVIGEDLCHAEFDSENSIDCHRVYSLLWPCRGADCLALLLHRLHYACSRPNALISTSTPGGKSSFISASTVSGVGSRMSINRLCVRISNCSRDFLSTCGDRKTVHRLITVGRGIGPATSAPVRFAVSTISRVDWSRMRWSNAFKRILILSPCLIFFTR